MDETPTSVITETPTNEVGAAQPGVVAETVNAENPPQLAPGTDLRKLERTVEVVRNDPGGQKVLADKLGFVTADEVNRIRLADARDAAIEAYSIPADKQKFVVGTTPAEIRASAKELADLLKPAPTSAATDTEPTSQPTATKVELPQRSAEKQRYEIRNRDDIAAAYEDFVNKK